MAYQISSNIVIDDSGNVIVTGNISATTLSGKGLIPQSSTLTFEQASAPTGFTKVTTYNDYTLRVVSGTGGVTGGSVNFTSAFTTVPVSVPNASVTVGGFTLTVPTLASHTHGPRGYSPGGTFAPPGASFDAVASSIAAGGGDPHTHSSPSNPGVGSLGLNVRYVDVILATKD